MFPLTERIQPAPDAEEVFLRLATRPHCVFFDSALRDPLLGRFSFVAADPFDFVRVAADGTDGLQLLKQRLEVLATPSVERLPPFQGGAAGLFGYELGRSLEMLPVAANDEFHVPALGVGLYDVLVAIDHQTDEAWIISQGFPETEPTARRRRAEQRLAEMRQWLAKPRRTRPGLAITDPIEPGDLARQYGVSADASVTSNFSAAAYQEAVQRVIDYIRAGDVFQVNLSQRLLHPATDDSVALYLRLRRRNAAPFAGFFDLGELQLCSASPERFLKLNQGRVEARPIKGTRARTARPEADLFAGDDLRQSEKDRAENVMIVDLMRNDLSRVCVPQRVQVTQLCGLETYAYVQHLVSVIQGEMRADVDAIDLLRAAFPGGSITGAPKLRAMEIIAELEPNVRGAYCGSLGYLGFDGTLDTSILIRTVTAGRGWWQLPVGGGIVAQSRPWAEYEETWHKAEGMIRALRP